MQEVGGGGFYRVRKHVALFSFSAVDFQWDKNKAAVGSDIQCFLVTLCGPLIIEKSPAAASAPSGSGGKS